MLSYAFVGIPAHRPPFLPTAAPAPIVPLIPAMPTPAHRALSSPLVSFPPTRPTSLHFALIHRQSRKLCDHLSGPIRPDPFLDLGYSVSVGVKKWGVACVRVAYICLCISIKRRSIQSVFEPTVHSPFLPRMKEHQNMY